jgi:hypothetical protein
MENEFDQNLDNDTSQNQVDDDASETQDNKVSQPPISNNVSDERIDLLNEQLLKSEKKNAEVVNKFAKLVGYVEGAGLVKYDPETGDVIRTNVNHQDEGRDLQQEIAKKEQALMDRRNDQEISQEEYWIEKQRHIAPLKDKLREIQDDKRLKEAIKAAKNEMKSDLERINQQREEKVTIQSNRAVYNELFKQFPDLDNKNSELFKQMTEIYNNNPEVYGDASYNEGRGNAAQFKDLIERSVKELRYKGINIQDRKAAIRSQFANPGSRGYQEPQKKMPVSKSELESLVGPISDKSLLAEVNAAMINWENTGQIVLKD